MSEITAQTNIQAARAARKRENLRAWTDKNRAHVNEQARLWYQAHKEEVQARRKAPSRREQQRQYRQQRYAQDPAFREQARLKAAAWRAANLEVARARARARYHANLEKHKEASARYRADPIHQEAARRRSAEWIAKNPERYKERRLKEKANWRRDYLRSKYGLSWEEYQQMLVTQDYRCAICRSEFPTQAVHATGSPFKWICVDHCHATERVRDLLCPTCNFILGHAFDRPDLLRTAADYLERHAAKAQAA